MMFSISVLNSRDLGKEIKNAIPLTKTYPIAKTTKKPPINRKIIRRAILKRISLAPSGTVETTDCPSLSKAIRTLTRLFLLTIMYPFLYI